MILAVDVSYRGDAAVAAGVLFRAWEDSEPVDELIVPVAAVAEYEPSQFWKRELPCVLAVLQHLEQLPDVIIVDGHVYLDADGRPGLGRRLYDALGGRCAVVGVAKSRFKETPLDVAVYRGGSKRALHVTAVGISQSDAKDAVLAMHGAHGLPAMLKRADQLSRSQRAAQGRGPGR